MSGGWDDDDDDLLAMLDEDDDIISNSGGDNKVASAQPLNYENTKHPNNTTSALNSNPFLSNDNDDIDVDNGIVDDSHDMGGNGWDDDDLDLSDELNISDIKDSAATPQQPPTLQSTSAVPPPPPPPPIHTSVNSNVSNINEGSNNRVDVGSPTTQNTFEMLAAHEKVLNKEIDNINVIEQQQQQQQLQKSAENQNDINISDEWDFDDDDADIFNEDNVDLECNGDGNEDELVPNPPLSLQPSPREIRPSTSNATAHQEEEKQVPPPPPGAPAPPVQQKLDTNPFLTNNSIGKDVEEPTLINETSITNNTANNGSGKAVVDNADADGWSDEDFFDDDDDMLQSTSLGVPPQPSNIPPPPPHPSPTPQQHLSPPIAQRTRAKTASAHRQQPQEQQPTSSQQLNPSQKRIHDMLSTYMSSLHNPNFLTNLHYTLHQHQSKNNNVEGSSNKSAASDLRTYYTTRPGLKKYTLGIELTRMDYKLILQNGQVINDKDVIRSYFGVSSTGERLDGVDDEEESAEASIEELLVRSANQSLLADMLVALTGLEDSDSLSESGGGLILSGPTLCMTSVAESCQFKIDLSSDVVEAVCLLAISVPFHDDAAITQAKLSYHGNVNDIIKDGRLILARAQVSVRFRPGDGEEMNDEPTVQYTVQSITPYHTATSELITTAAISLAQDQPFFHDEYADVNVDDVQMIDARDRFLLSHHLADSGLLVVSDHIDRLKDAAEQHSTGFRSALRQLDGVTNVSSKLSGIREGFGLALPSAEEIEAAEREAAASHHNIPRPPPPPDAGFRIPRPEQVMEHNVPPPPSSEFRFPRPEQVAQSNVQSRPPPPPPPPTQQNDAPRPLIGGLFMSGLSRLAAAASQPDDNNQAESGWGNGGGTGLTPPSSPGNNQAPSEMPPTLYRRDESEHPQITQGLANQFRELTAIPRSGDLHPAQEHENGLNDEVEKQDEEDEEDAGWSDDEFDFDDDLGGNDEIEEETRVSNNEMKGDNKIQETASLTPQKPHRPFKTTIEYQEESERESFKILMAMETKPAVVLQPQMAKELEVDGHSSRGGNHQPLIHHKPPSNNSMKAVPPPPPPLPKPKTTNQQQQTFEEEFVMVLSDKISAECQEMEDTGHMKRWRPISEDPILRKQLMDVMVAQLT